MIWMTKYIYQNKDWTNFSWDSDKISLLLGEIRFLQGKIYAQVQSLGFFITRGI